MRTCSACTHDFPATDAFFYRKGGRLSGWCKECEKAASRRYAQAHRDQERAAARTRSRRNADLVRRLRAAPCEVCGLVTEPSINHFHHRDPSDKSFKLSNCGGRAESTVLAEVAKCALLCPNCHAIEHTKEA